MAYKVVLHFPRAVTQRWVEQFCELHAVDECTVKVWPNSRDCTWVVCCADVVDAEELTEFVCRTIAYVPGAENTSADASESEEKSCPRKRLDATSEADVISTAAVRALVDELKADRMARWQEAKQGQALLEEVFKAVLKVGARRFENPSD